MTNRGRSAASAASPNGSGVLSDRRLRRYSSRLTCGLSPGAQRFLYQEAARWPFSLLRPVYRGGDKPVEDGENPPDGLGRGQNSHDAVLLAALPSAIVRLEALDLLECSENALLEKLCGGVDVGVRTALGLGHDPV